MSVYNPNDPRDYMAFLKQFEKLKDNKCLIEMKKFHPIASDKQQHYLNFMISYLALKMGDTFYTTLREIQRRICPHIFYTEERDKQGERIYRPLTSLNSAQASSVIRNVIDYASVRGIMIPEPDDKLSLKYCERELESSSAGWV